MSLPPGTKLGPYEIQSPLGAGGMGEVYRARDTRLDRTVAVKILPAHLSSNAEAKQRFEREARVISSLNHQYLYPARRRRPEWNLLSGDGVRARRDTPKPDCEKGPLPLKQVWSAACRFATRSKSSPRRHRASRPEARQHHAYPLRAQSCSTSGWHNPAGLGAPVSSHVTPSSPTMHMSALTSPAGSLTQQGTIVGTFQYMAPEVLQGQEADARSDIFSFGAVLYEMVAGKRAFEGKSQFSVASAILDKEPEPISKVQPMAPAAMDHVVIECLAKTRNRVGKAPLM